MKKLGNILWGLIFIAIGIIFGINALGIASINIFFDGWWTLFIIIPCAIGLVKDSEKTGSIIGLLIGIMLLLSSQNIIDFDLVWKLLVPIALVVIGISIIFKDAINTEFNKEIQKLNQNKDGYEEHCATFAGQDINFDNQDFNGADLTAVFGAIKCDLRKANIESDKVINVTAIFGGIEIYVPDDVQIKIKSTPIFGGVTNETKSSSEATKVLYINATCTFGGVEVK